MGADTTELGSDQSFKCLTNPYLVPRPPIPAHVLSVEMDCINYCFEAASLQGTQNWPVPYIEPEKLAATGFYYTGHDDKLKCFECGIEICYNRHPSSITEYQNYIYWTNFNTEISSFLSINGRH